MVLQDRCIHKGRRQRCFLARKKEDVVNSHIIPYPFYCLHFYHILPPSIQGFFLQHPSAVMVFWVGFSASNGIDGQPQSQGLNQSQGPRTSYLPISSRRPGRGCSLHGDQLESRNQKRGGTADRCDLIPYHRVWWRQMCLTRGQ